MPASYLPDRLFKNPAFVDEVAIAPHGFVKLVRVDGDDDFIALSARHGKESDNPTPKLIRYMMRHNHTTPFEMVGLVFHLKMPMFVANQWKRHRMATINELSLRYDEATGEYWLPQGGKWRKQSTNNHQGSTDELIEIPALRCEAAGMMNLDAEEVAFEEYKSRIAQGASREQARSCLPVSIYTDFFWKVDLHNCFRFLKLRLDPHAQAEIREMSQIVENFVRQAFPIAYAAWVDCVRDAITLTVQDQQALVNFLDPDDGMMDVSKDFPSDREKKEFQKKLAQIWKRTSRAEVGTRRDESDPAYFPGNQDGDA